MRQLAAALIVALTILATTFGSGSAQDATPIAPNPEQCTLEPVTFEQLEAVIATPEVNTETYSESLQGTPVALPPGDPVDEDTQQSIEASMLINIACQNTGDVLQIMAVFTDEGLKQQLGNATSIGEDEYAMLQTPTPLDEREWNVIYDVSDAVALEDGKVGIVLVGDVSATADPPTATLFILVEQGGHWFIDSLERTDS